MAGLSDLRIRITADGTQASRAMQQVGSGMGRLRDESTRTERAMVALRGAFTGFAAQVAGALGLASIARSFVTTAVEMDKLNRGLVAVTGSSKSAAAEMAYITGIANKMGLRVQDAAGAYLSLSAAAKGTALEGQGAKDIFEAISLAMGKLGKSSADTSGALLAVEQMISKGKVSAEELRGQLGERLPGAFQAAARAMGWTTEELDEMLKSGQVVAEDLLPKMARELNKLYDDGTRIGGLNAAWNRLMNAIDSVYLALDKLLGLTPKLETFLSKVGQGLTVAANVLEGKGLQVFESETERYNFLIGERTRLMEELAATEKRMQDRTGRDGLLEWMGVGAEQSKMQLAGLKNELNGVEQAIIAMDEANLAGIFESATPAANKLTESAKDLGEVLEGEAKVVRDLENAYGLYAGQLDAVWYLESSRGKKVGVDSSKWVTVEERGLKVAREIRGEFQMMVTTAAGLGGSMETFNGQAELAAKYLKEAKDQGKSLWEQFAYYHGGPNRKGWKEDTIAYADAAVKIVETANKAMGDLGSNTGREIEKGQEAASRALLKLAGDVRQLEDQYLPAEAAARRFAEAQIILAEAVKNTGFSQEKATAILAAMKKEMDETGEKAKTEASAFAKVWENAVERLDDAFAGMWKDLFTGTKTTLESLKDMLMSWLAEMAHALLTRPLTVAISTAMVPGAASAGGVGGAGGLGGLGGIGSWFGSTSMGTSIGSGLSSFAGSTFGAMPNWFGSGIANLGMTPNWALGAGGILGGLAGNMLFGDKGYGAIGSSIGSTAGAVIGSMILPGIGTILGGLLGGTGGGFLGSLFGDDEPEYGSYAMASGSSYWKGLEDAKDGAENYAEGAFGLKFGISDSGSKNFDASEMKEIFDGFAQVSEVLADFFGADVARQIEQSFEEAGGLTLLSKDVDEAMRKMVEIIAQAGAETGDEVAVVFQAVLGTLSGDADQVLEQMEYAMEATAAMLDMTKRLEFTDLGAAFDLTGTTAENAVKLVEFAETMKKAGESTAEAAVRVTAELAQLEFAMRYTATSIEGLSQEQIGTAAAGLAEAMGGVEELMAAQQFYYEQFTTATEMANDAMQLIIAELQREFPKIQESLLGLNLDQITIDIPALLDRVQPQLEQEVESIQETMESLQRAYAEGQVSLAQYAVELGKFSDGTADLEAEMRSSQQAQEDLQRAYAEGTISLAQYSLGMKEFWEGMPSTASLTYETKPLEKGNLAEVDASAKAVLRAVEMYTYGLEQGTLSQNAETEAKLTEALNFYGEEIAAYGLSVAEGLFSVADQIDKLGISTDFMSQADRDSLTKDQNAEIYAQLVNDLPQSRGEFNALIAQIDVTTEAGQLLYAELMKLVPAFDAMYDSIESFEAWLGVTDQISLAGDRLRQVFWDYIGEMPTSVEGLKALYESGVLTAEQLAILGANLADLDLLFGGIDAFETWIKNDPTAPTQAALDTLTGLFEGFGMTLPKTRDELEALYESGGLTAEQMAILGGYIDELTTVFDELEGAIDGVIDAYAAQRESLLELADILDPRGVSQADKDKADQALRDAGYTGDLYDAEGLAAFLRALSELDDAGGEAGEALLEMSDILKAVFDEVARIAEERAGLEMRLLELTGTDAEILAEKRRLELAAVDESNRAILERIYALEDEAAAAERAAAAMAVMASLTERLYAAAGDDAMVTQLQRQAELAAALSDGARAMLLMIYAIEDATAGQLAAQQAAEEAARAAEEAAREAFDARQDAAREEYDAIREVISTLQSLRDALQSAIDAIYVDTPQARIASREEAQAKITEALMAARGGTLPDLEALAPYLQVVSQNAEGQFATLVEYQRNAYRTRAELEELERLAGEQQTIEEQMLEALQAILDEEFPASRDNADENGDKISWNIEQLIAIANAINEGVLSMDADLDGVITFAEMQAALVGIATDAEIRALFEMLDTNGDGVLSALEALPLKIAQNLSGMFDMLDTNMDGLLTFDELKAGLGPLATDEQILALMGLMDTNNDGVISKLEAIRYQIVTDSNALFGRMDTDSSKMLTRTEFNAALAGKASDTKLEAIWQGLDANHDGLLDATEALPLSIANSLSTHFDDLDTNVDGLLTFAELKAGLGGLATDSQLQTMLTILDANGDGMISEQEAAYFKLTSIDETADAQLVQMQFLESINAWAIAAHTTRTNMYDRMALTNSKLDSINAKLANIDSYTWKSWQNDKLLAQHFTGFSYATGGIADGPLSGYGATLHGREAVIPLGDGNKITATLLEPANYLQNAPDTAELRQALAELHAELKELRRDNQQIGATTASELKEHNRRERRRDVVPQQVTTVTAGATFAQAVY